MRAPDTNEVLLQVDGVALAFGGVRALRDVSFNIRKGEIRAIIGPNGAGKTSMLNVINGFYHPDHCSITFKGAPGRGCNSPPSRGEAGFVKRRARSRGE